VKVDGEESVGRDNRVLSCVADDLDRLDAVGDEAKTRGCDHDGCLGSGGLCRGAGEGEGVVDQGDLRGGMGASELATWDAAESVPRGGPGGGESEAELVAGAKAITSGRRARRRAPFMPHTAEIGAVE